MNKGTQYNRTAKEQDQVQNLIQETYQNIYLGKDQSDDPDSDDENQQKIYFNAKDNIQQHAILKRKAHEQYLHKSLHNFGYYAKYYDSGLPWLIYWNIHSMNLLDIPLNKIHSNSMIDFIKSCQNKQGGFSGSQYLIPHIASSYAAVLALIEIGTEDAYNCIDRKGMYRFLHKVKNPNRKGSFLINENGEEDLRAVYIVVTIATILNLDIEELLEDSSDFISECQTHEGGISCIPGSEAHGGYTFCGLAALVALKQTNKINMNKLIYWLSSRQLSQEGGFNGRTQKVVDACYSFWQACCFKLINVATDNQCSYDNQMIYGQMNMQMYLLLCCQNKDGGLKDKPGKSVDLYHTCYSLSGLSLSQESVNGYEKDYQLYMNIQENKLVRTDPIFNVVSSKLEQAIAFFKNLQKIDQKTSID